MLVLIIISVYTLQYSYENALEIISRFESNARIYRFSDGAIVQP